MAFSPRLDMENLVTVLGSVVDCPEKDCAPFSFFNKPGAATGAETMENVCSLPSASGSSIVNPDWATLTYFSDGAWLNLAAMAV